MPFSQFADADEYLIALLLAEAMTQVDDSWLEQDYQNAVMYLTAHLLVTETAAGSGTGGGTSGIIASESFGPLSRSYHIDTTAITDEGLEGTLYGRRYRELRRKNFPGVVVA